MTTNRIAAFKDLHAERVLENPGLWSLPQDKLASLDELDRIEKWLGRNLSLLHRGFLASFGGGDFGFVQCLSVDPESPMFMCRVPKEILPERFIPFSDDGAGGYYGYLSNSDSVYYWNADGGMIATDFCDLLDYLENYAYSPAAP